MTDQRIRGRVIQKHMRVKIKERLTREQRRIKEEVNKVEKNNERKKSMWIQSYVGHTVPACLIHTFFM